MSTYRFLGNSTCIATLFTIPLPPTPPTKQLSKDDEELSGGKEE